MNVKSAILGVLLLAYLLLPTDPVQPVRLTAEAAAPATQEEPTSAETEITAEEVFRDLNSLERGLPSGISFGVDSAAGVVVIDADATVTGRARELLDKAIQPYGRLVEVRYHDGLFQTADLPGY